MSGGNGGRVGQDRAALGVVRRRRPDGVGPRSLVSSGSKKSAGFSTGTGSSMVAVNECRPEPTSTGALPSGSDDLRRRVRRHA